MADQISISEEFSNNANESWRKEVARRRKDFREGKDNAIGADEALRQAQASIE